MIKLNTQLLWLLSICLIAAAAVFLRFQIRAAQANIQFAQTFKTVKEVT
jgi:hypothetical protein